MGKLQSEAGGALYSEQYLTGQDQERGSCYRGFLAKKSESVVQRH